jgi:tetratricopeptide (TPR) repeat protein
VLVPELLSPSEEVRTEARWLLLISLRNQGRLREAMALAAEARIPGSGVRIPGATLELTHLRLILLEMGRSAEAASLFLEPSGAETSAETPPGLAARIETWRLTHAGLALAAAGDTGRVRSLADSVEVLGRLSIFGRDLRLHHFLRGLLLQRQGRHADAVEAFRQALFSTTDGYTRINLEMARSLMVLGRLPEAIAILQPALRGGVDGSNTYVTHTELHEAAAQAFSLAGMNDSARTNYLAVEAAWRRADPEFRDRYGRARAWLDSHQRQD